MMLSDATPAEQPSISDLLRAARVSERRQLLAARLGLAPPTEQNSSDDGSDDGDNT